MVTFKIKSNPYKKEILFWSMDEETQQLIPLTTEDNSTLVSDAITAGFFPYNIKKIVDEIIAMKAKPGQPMQLIFEGTEDEYEDLWELCQKDSYRETVELQPLEHYLENASGILPEIAEIFQDMQPLIEESVQSNEAISFRRKKKKFEEAVDKQVIPICVIGNYSSGKSTFINALVGKEILPSGDDPVTDCVYEITRSQNAEDGSVEFEYQGLPVSFSFNESGRCKISGAGKDANAWIAETQAKLEAESAQPVHVRIHDLLALIEAHKKQLKRENANKDIASLIKITLPFSKEGVLSQSQCNYKIFDTPGEGSATNVDHSQILKQQMESLSNGLILFLTDNKSLDKIEGRDLCEKLIHMECFDNRFTMVIANRADCAKLPKEGFQPEDAEMKLEQTVCRTLQSNRIFYVSSIVGLGSKQGETFLDEDYQDVFDKEVESYTNPDAKHPKALYRYDIIPEQIKKRCVERSLREENRAFANSGLYWIEQEIRLFAEVYSPYNKCNQSKRFLDEIIQETSRKIDESQEQIQGTKQTLEENLGEKDKLCKDALQENADACCERYSQSYPTQEMTELVETAQSAISREMLESRQAEIEVTVKEAHQYEAQKEDARFFKEEAATDTTKADSPATSDEPAKKLTGGFSTLFKKATQSITDTIQSVSDTMEKKSKISELEKLMEKEISAVLFNEIKKQFDEEMHAHQATLDEASKQYWTNQSEDFRLKMIDTVTNSKGIPEEKRVALEEIIANYEALAFDKTADMVFKLEELKRHLFQLDDFIVGETDALNLRKLTQKYNTSMHESLQEIMSRLATSHQGSFDTWQKSLLQVLMDNTIDLNPELRKLQNQIEEQERQIRNLENRKQRLEDYQMQIEHLMSWR